MDVADGDEALDRRQAQRLGDHATSFEGGRLLRRLRSGLIRRRRRRRRRARCDRQGHRRAGAFALLATGGERQRERERQTEPHDLHDPSSYFGRSISLVPGPVYARAVTSPPSSVAAAWTAGRARWPLIATELSVFERFTASLPEAAIARFAEDLFLACACAHGEPAAVRVFEELLLPPAQAAIRSIDSTPTFVDEATQRLRTHLLVGERDGRVFNRLDEARRSGAAIGRQEFRYALQSVAAGDAGGDIADFAAERIVCSPRKAPVVPKTTSSSRIART